MIQDSLDSYLKENEIFKTYHGFCVASGLSFKEARERMGLLERDLKRIGVPVRLLCTLTDVHTLDTYGFGRFYIDGVKS